ncbi:ABC-type multidrug transport system, ATPase component [Owenweeksia hongkongensis DSM 17368]|uniref:ABC-type multidrug transport system, ATPase component n=1 Tax=Owenweeksia hongkongensis (strain DSM 17368 / CIP 108786 / JCM 12287 / NRRL B-23963 / UST20020801) TaxID=926562 RepID=G8R2U2_OWEHD|nr:ABC transporter ATP-binding protein [Owenweeksia hongkongensis]AEV31897.1 ABC-type multidrug transport system, ATPase component [Owenweeksia hongkongensis DSM 17368]
MQAVQVQNLSHQYKGAENPLMQNLNLSVNEGQSFGLFGPNGAGKTTLMSLITGVIKPQTGSVKLLGLNMTTHKKEVRHQFGYVPQSLSFYDELTPIQNLEYFGAMMGLSRKQIKDRGEALLHVLGLEKVGTKPVKEFSGGMKRRVNLAIGVLHQPRILFLDEPTVGVDVQTRHAIIQYLKELNANGTTLFYTSHHLSEAQELCNEIALMDNGEILAKDSLEIMLKNHGEETLENLFLKLTGKQYRD